MNELNIPRIPKTAKAADIFNVFEAQKVPFHAIDNVCWPEEYPYKPEAEFAIANDDEALLVAYKVHEKCIRALALDGGHVWEDSCCELFIAPDATGYYNIECNCTGHPLVAFGPGRNDRKPASPEPLKLIDRFTTLGSEPFDLKEGDFKWQMALRIPKEVFFMHPGLQLQGTMRGNFYKCGDKTIPHFLAWNKVGTPTPDFHQPAYFGVFHL